MSHGSGQRWQFTVPDSLRTMISSIAVVAPRGPKYVVLPDPRLQLLLREGTTSGVADAFLVGARRRAYRKPASQRRTLIIRFRAQAARALTGEPLAAFSGRIVPIAEAWGADVPSRLGDASQSADPARWARDVCAALSPRLRRDGGRTATNDSLLREASRLLTGRAGVTVAEAAARLGYSERHFRRLVREGSGLSPKELARSRRFRRAVRMARRAAADGWSGIAMAAGYYDQAHMNREFRELAGATPTQLLAELAQGEVTQAARPAVPGGCEELHMRGRGS